MKQVIKKWIVPLLLVFVMTLTVRGVAFASDGAPQDAAHAPPRGYGVVMALGDNEFTVESSNGREITFQVNERTRFRSPSGDVDGFEDLRVGHKVIVTSRMLRRRIASTVRVLPDDFNPGERFGVRMRGIITAVDPDSNTFELENQDGKVVSVVVDEKTRYKGQAGSLDELEVGWEAGVAGEKTQDGSLKAGMVLAGEVKFSVKARGEISAVDLEDETFNLETPAGEVLTFQVNQETQFRGQLESLDEMRVGWDAGVAGQEDEDGTLLAGLVLAGKKPERVKARGEISAVDLKDQTFTLETPSGEQQTYHVDEKTIIRGRSTSLADLRVGWDVGVSGIIQEDGSFRAVLIVAGEADNLVKSRGEVVDIDLSAGAFSLETAKGETLTFQVGEKTRFKGQLSALDDLEIGQQAGVLARKTEDGSLLCLMVIAGNPTDHHGGEYPFSP